MSENVDEAIILAGGRGARLQSVVSVVPKPLAPVAGRPFIAWLLDGLAAGGIHRAILATGYLSEQVEAYVGVKWKGMSIAYSVEEEPLGTGGAISRAISQLRGRAVHVVNGDTYLRFVPAALQAAAESSGSPMAVALAEVEDVARYGAVLVDAGKIGRFMEKGGSGAGRINAGCYFLGERALSELPREGRFSLEQDFIGPQVLKGNVAAFDDTSDFIDIGIPEDYAKAQIQFDTGTCHRSYVDPRAATQLATAGKPRRALFLDRDGVININHGYVHDPANTDFLPGIFDLCRLARDAGMLLVVVTNQAGIARGFYDEARFIAYTAWLHEEFAARGVPLLATHYCPHHPLAAVESLRLSCPSRKPGAGMLLTAAGNYGIDLSKSLLIGDKESDLDAGRLAGIPGRFLVDGPRLGDASNWLSAHLVDRGSDEH